MDFFERYKKIFFIIGFLAIVIAVGFALYTLFLKPSLKPQPDQDDISTTTGKGLPGAGEGDKQIVEPISGAQKFPATGGISTPSKASQIANGGVTKTDKINDVPSLGATIAGNGQNVQYYNQDNGKFYKIDRDGNLTPLSDKTFFNVENITWAGNKDKAVIEFPDGANIVYNFSTNKQVTLPKHWKEFEWSPDSDSLVLKSIGLDPDNRWLAISKDDGSKIIPIDRIGNNDDTIYPSWSPNNQTIAMYTKGLDFDRQEVFFVGKNNENFKSLVIEGRDFQSLWAPQGDKLLYSAYSSKDGLKPNLWLANAQGELIGTGRKKLNIETWANKCTYTNSNAIYCAVPEKLEEGAGLFPELGKASKDRLFKIDPSTGLKTLVAIPDSTYNMSNLIVSDDGQYLYFTDEKEKRLHKIQLK